VGCTTTLVVVVVVVSSLSLGETNNNKLDELFAGYLLEMQNVQLVQAVEGVLINGFKLVSEKYEQAWRGAR
jgi:hypothetical protein